ncbi:MAG: single-stranded-DNA-specific exonuclease RecJ [Fimbriimonadaceae bacterium]|nr:single-stranded-DNA-specific exonuclease RecJ [Fimbriimonadaceae bacterium]QYK55226.1 MAG: single-stranded-DNA-specific exonuclease RecJ [Fimbriimonadaceae bacterium]
MTTALAMEVPLWIVPPRDPAAEGRLQSELGIPSLLAAILVARGFTDPAEADRFLHPSLDHFHDPSLLPDYEAAVGEILGARERGETIYVHGDYDADGVTSAALFTRFLKRIGCEVVPHVPHRLREGYGIHMDAVGWAHEKGAKLFLTCDCGVAAHEQVRAARDFCMRVVVTDHHQVGDTLPDAQAVVNPHRRDSRYPWPEISGVGVALKLCAGITRDLKFPVEKFYRAYLDLAVLGTVADVMPLLDENRVIARFGLDELRQSKKTGVRALLRVSELADQELTARHIGFQLGPRINAVGRIDDSAIALDLLLTEDVQEAARLARIMDQTNTERRLEQERCIEEAVLMVEEMGVESRHVIYVADPTWHSGLVGLIAGRLVERFRRPAFAATIVGEVAKGSARSIDGFHLKEALDAHRSHILGGGGHAMAAGFSLDVSRQEEFAAALEAYGAGFLTAEHFRRKLVADCEIDPKEAGAKAFEAVRPLMPFGTANPEPSFVCRRVRFQEVTATRKPEHVRVKLQTTDGLRQAMAFHIGERATQKHGCDADIVFHIEENKYNGRTSVRWKICDLQDCAD